MKKMFLMVTVLFFSMVANAQVVLFEGSLKDALAKAKSENKMVMLYCTAALVTVIETDFFQEEDVYNLVNEKFIVKKYTYDQGPDTDNIIGTYGEITMPPTFLFLSGDGEELNRMIGGTRYYEDFVKRINELASPENFHKARDAQFRKSPNFEYIDYLANRLYMKDKADEATLYILENGSVKENFSDERLNYYESYIKNPNSLILDYAVKNEKKIVKAIGQKKYDMFMAQNAVKFAMKSILSYNPQLVHLEKDLSDIKANPVLAKVSFVEFADAIKNHVVAGDCVKIIDVASEKVKTADSFSREMIINAVIQLTTREFNASLTDKTLALFTTAIAAEKNLETKSILQQDLNKFKEYLARYDKK